MVIYELNGQVQTITFVGNIPTTFPYPFIVTNNVPSEPIESWYIEDGEIKIDQQKLIEFNRKNMPTLSKREFRKRLRDANLFEQVDAYVKASNDGYLQDAWEYADYFTRLDPFIIQVSSDIGLTPERVDQISTVAS